MSRLLASATLAALFAVVPASAVQVRTIFAPGVQTAAAQGGMDIGILTPSFSALPQTVPSGQPFDIGVATAPGARCSGVATFRHHPPIELAEVMAPGGACAWTVDVPSTVRSGTGTIVVTITRSGQSWGLTGIVYVSAIGEPR